MNVGIIGCGGIGRKRAAAMGGKSRLVACADPVLERAQSLAATAPGAAASRDWQEVIGRSDLDIVIASTTHDALAEITLAAVRAGKHVLVEKPAARSAAELEPVMDAASVKGAPLVRVGFNHRFHPAVLKARELINAREVGDLMFLRARYGHGGRIGYEKEWRADPARSGGGELIDQGVHLIDLSRLFLGDFTNVQGFSHTYYWDMPVEDNGFLLLRTADDRVAFLHASCTEWKNLFSMEIYGRVGKLELSGLGGSYGCERLTFYKMLPSMGPPETAAWEWPMGDCSWAMEFEEFLDDIARNRAPSPGLADAHAALSIVRNIYDLSQA